LLVPVIAWTLVATVVWGLFRLAGMLAPSPKQGKESLESYACGEAESESRPFAGIGREYEPFFGAVLLFTITEAAVLIMITLPSGGKIPAAAFGLLAVVVACSAGLLDEIAGPGTHGGSRDA